MLNENGQWMVQDDLESTNPTGSGLRKTRWNNRGRSLDLFASIYHAPRLHSDKYPLQRVAPTTFVTNETHYFADFPEEDTTEWHLRQRELTKGSFTSAVATRRTNWCKDSLSAWWLLWPVDSGSIIITIANPGLCKSKLVRDGRRGRSPLRFR